ncbi:hypothetical protein EIMP300_86030 [Escherichia coli]|uniref:Uncharacterized protein n=1 Tax=Escherichia coli TaxID=562 RepID=A0A8S0G5J1_ECOLX|nr:hypothetical protein EIMP300_86030 [Escherichia coli]
MGGKTILRFPASCDSRAIVVRYRHTFPVKYTAWSQKKAVARSVAVSWIIWGKSALNSWNAGTFNSGEQCPESDPHRTGKKSLYKM